MPSGSIRKVKPWTEDEAREFLDTARGDRLYALWAVALAIGLRRGEALGLRWANVDLTGGSCSIKTALSRVGELASRDVKTESPRHQCRCPTNWSRFCGNIEESNSPTLWLHRATRLDWYSQPDGTPLIAERQPCVRIAVPACRCTHDPIARPMTLVRDTSVAMEDAATVQPIPRHSSITVTTGTYVDVIERVQRDAVSEINRYYQRRVQ